MRPTPIGAFGPAFQQLVPGLDCLGGAWSAPSGEFLIGQADAVRTGYGLARVRLAGDPARAFDRQEKKSAGQAGALAGG